MSIRSYRFRSALQARGDRAVAAFLGAALLCLAGTALAKEPAVYIHDPDCRVAVDPEHRAFGVVLVEKLGVLEVDGKRMPRSVSREHEEHLSFGGGSERSYTLLQVGAGEHAFRVRYVASRTEKKLFSRDRKRTEYARSHQDYTFRIEAGRYYILRGSAGMLGWQAELLQSEAPVVVLREGRKETLRLRDHGGRSVGCDYIADRAFRSNIRTGEIDRVRLLLVEHPCLTGHFGATALQLAARARQNRKPLIELLVAHGADPEAVVDSGTALHVAAGYADEEAVNAIQALIAAGARVDARNRDGDTPLTRACKAGSRETAEELLRSGAELSPAEAQKLLFRAAERNARGVVELLERHGARRDVFISAYIGDTEFLRRAAASQPGILLARLDQEHREGFGLLHLAARNGHLETVEFLLAQGSSVNDRSHRGETPLHQAARGLQLEMVERLVSKGADVHARAEGAVVSERPCMCARMVAETAANRDRRKAVIAFLEKLEENQ